MSILQSAAARFDISALPPFASVGFPADPADFVAVPMPAGSNPVEFEDAPRLDLAGPWLLGHAFGTHGASPRLPAEYDEAQAESFREGWQAGDMGRRVTRGWPRELVADDVNEYLAERWVADHDAQPCPPDEFDLALADLHEGHDEARAFVEEERSSRAARRASAGPITDSDVAPLGVC